jgi:hypothetical protein
LADGASAVTPVLASSWPQLVQSAVAGAALDDDGLLDDDVELDDAEDCAVGLESLEQAAAAHATTAIATQVRRDGTFITATVDRPRGDQSAGRPAITPSSCAIVDVRST